MGMAGILVYMELGLTLPLYRFDGVEISVPRSGGELNYVSAARSLIFQVANMLTAQIHLRKTPLLHNLCFWDSIHPPWKCGNKFNILRHESSRCCGEIRHQELR